MDVLMRISEATTMFMRDAGGAHSEGKLQLEMIASASEQAVCSLQQSREGVLSRGATATALK
jgi:hypothetical protein